MSLPGAACLAEHGVGDLDPHSTLSKKARQTHKQRQIASGLTPGSAWGSQRPFVRRGWPLQPTSHRRPASCAIDQADFGRGGYHPTPLSLAGLTSEKRWETHSSAARSLAPKKLQTCRITSSGTPLSRASRGAGRRGGASLGSVAGSSAAGAALRLLAPQPIAGRSLLADSSAAYAAYYAAKAALRRQQNSPATASQQQPHTEDPAQSYQLLALCG